MSVNYRIRINDHLQDYWSARFEKMTINNLENGETELAGPVEDQDALYHILEKIRDLNLTLVSLEQEGEQQIDSDNVFEISEGLVYEFRVKGIGEPWWVGWFEEVDIHALEKGEFQFTVNLKDLPALHGLLDRVHAAHLTLLSVHRVPASPSAQSYGSVHG